MSLSLERGVGGRADLVIVGNAGGTNIGASFHRAAGCLGLKAAFCDARDAHSGPAFVRRFNWRIRGHRPTLLGKFSADVTEACRMHSPRVLLTTGLAPIDGENMDKIGKMGIERINYLTDDPWNPGQSSQWFFRALRSYDSVFSARQANLNDLRQHGCADVQYLPFAYDDELFPPGLGGRTRSSEAYDVVFAGGADEDRVPFIRALHQSGLKMALAGDYWDRSPFTKRYRVGHLDPTKLREITADSKIALCLVRRANRDGHVMRSFEIPAIGTCMLAEDTLEHRAIFGEDGDTVLYFRTAREMTDKVKWLLANDKERRRLAEGAHRRVVGGRHTYKDRLKAMLKSK